MVGFLELTLVQNGVRSRAHFCLRPLLALERCESWQQLANNLLPVDEPIQLPLNHRPHARQSSHANLVESFAWKESSLDARSHGIQPFISIFDHVEQVYQSMGGILRIGGTLNWKTSSRTVSSSERMSSNSGSDNPALLAVIRLKKQKAVLHNGIVRNGIPAQKS